MTDSDHALTPRAGTAWRGGYLSMLAEREAVIGRHLRRLATAYPDFAFSHEVVNPHRAAVWVAERKDKKAPGTRVVITADLMELHAALQRDKASHAAR